MILSRFVLHALLLLASVLTVRVGGAVSRDAFCECGDGGGGAADACRCDERAYLAALRDEFEREKDEWRQEFQLEKEAWLLDAERDAAASTSASAASAAVASGEGGDAAASLRAQHARELRAELELIQFPVPERCDTLPQIHFNYRQMGLGAAWHGLTLALTYAWTTHRTVVVDPQPLRWVWGDKEVCGDRTHECWFEPVTGCRAKLEGPHADIDYSQRDDEYKAQYNGKARRAMPRSATCDFAAVAHTHA